jgi:hypothetical protein
MIQSVICFNILQYLCVGCFAPLLPVSGEWHNTMGGEQPALELTERVVGRGGGGVEPGTVL